MRRFTDAQRATSDRWLGPRLHSALRLSRREAARRGVWRFLGVCVVPDYVRWRFSGDRDDPESPAKLERFVGADYKQALSRLWWMSEMFRNGPDYEPATRALGNQDVINNLFRMNVAHHRPIALGAVRVLSPGAMSLTARATRRMHSQRRSTRQPRPFCSTRSHWMSRLMTMPVPRGSTRRATMTRFSSLTTCPRGLAIHPLPPRASREWPRCSNSSCMKPRCVTVSGYPPNPNPPQPDAATVVSRAVAPRRARQTQYSIHAQMRPAPLRRGAADLVFPDQRLSVYVDGCYWHGCPRHSGHVGRSGRYCRDSAIQARIRDAQTDIDLKASGWHSLRIWEHEAPHKAADRIVATLDRLTRLEQSEQVVNPPVVCDVCLLDSSPQ